MARRVAQARLWLFAFMAALALAHPAFAQRAPARGPVLLVELTGVIGPPAAHHVEAALRTAEARAAEAVVLRINTPGGLETSMREIIEAILESRTPVIGYVAPPGGRAASAGTYILYATHLAAMAPGTNVGAATPVQLGSPAPENGEEEGGKDAEKVQPRTPSERKAINDAAAFLRSLAQMRGRNSEWGEQAVRLGAAVSAREAFELDIIEIVAGDVDDLLVQSDGRSVTTQAGERRLATRGRSVERVEPGFIVQALGVLANPNVAFLLMLIGVYGLIFEFANPGAIGPGVVGAVCLVLGLYALNQLPLNYAGLALIVLGIAFMVAEALTPTFGVLGLGGAIAFIVGASMLINTDVPAFRLSWGVILGAAAITGGFVVLALGVSFRSLRRRIVTGREGLIGETAEVLDWENGAGHVWTQGERWRAEGPEDLARGAKVRIVGVDSLRLRIAAAPKEGMKS
ncbi:MAG: nodulation protein NfeD [Hydrogenophilaceae bacterium]|jgi:membrane-bound serine protease (ClpP class)|nr:nodulation protein NfeD [Hydrogenophilaceae bacterium]